MKTGNYQISEILLFQNLEQLIIPEIQREYVWKEEDVTDLLKTLAEGLQNKDVPYLGFIYAYSHRDFLYKYFLIDGQQRMTTIFLILLACHRKLEKKLPAYLTRNNKVKLDYKVRQATHDFLRDLVNNIFVIDDKNRIEDQLWYHESYRNDVTIRNLIGNYYVIIDWLENYGAEEISAFLKLVESKVGLSYFNVEDGRQGEELYIYMNSRGRQLEPNETLKAKFLSRLNTTEEKFEWGRRWENWQDFFWKHRGGHPDADSGFNEFLRKLQVINMSAMNTNSDQISRFITGRSEQQLDINLLPSDLTEIDDYFEAYKFLVESKVFVEFLQKQNETSTYFLSTPSPERRQAFYLRVLPVLAFLARTKLREDQTIIRFFRFFYNVARKVNVGKDISTQLPIAIRLVLAYTNAVKEHFDVVHFADYQKGRTILIDNEEISKLSIYETPPEDRSRGQIETLFWKAEDHFICRGTIGFLLDHSMQSDVFSFALFEKNWHTFSTLFPKAGMYDAQIVKALLFYGNTWIKHTPNYYDNYECNNWQELVQLEKGKFLLQLITDMHDKEIAYLDEIFESKAKAFFVDAGLTSVESIKSQTGLFNQVTILAIIDHNSGKKLWKNVYHIAQDPRWTFKTYKDEPFFTEERLLYNVAKYINDGWQGRIIPMMGNVLNDRDKLETIIKNVISD
ncbi:MAG TPA: DUF262 domain-containing protein [Flavisolibacter sp.]|jgi:uncharacterized protein with ParB-like and HNH nuclease domain|nr:DUF262 domain-containing protein [Flavisolibacter sp.]